jgi:hypothetical protein
MNSKTKLTLIEKYPHSDPCSCTICQNYCRRPGWWTVEEVTRAIEAGFADRMMLEISPGYEFGVLSPAFRGNEGAIALQIFADQGCTFLKNGLCELFGTGFQPLECRYCHHSRKGMGEKCHHDIGRTWNNPEAKRLIVRWGNLTGFWQKQGLRAQER